MANASPVGATRSCATELGGWGTFVLLAGELQARRGKRRRKISHNISAPYNALSQNVHNLRTHWANINHVPPASTAGSRNKRCGSFLVLGMHQLKSPRAVIPANAGGGALKSPDQSNSRTEVHSRRRSRSHGGCLWRFIMQTPNVGQSTDFRVVELEMANAVLHVRLEIAFYRSGCYYQAST